MNQPCLPGKLGHAVDDVLLFAEKTFLIQARGMPHQRHAGHHRLEFFFAIRGSVRSRLSRASGGDEQRRQGDRDDLRIFHVLAIVARNRDE